jgi:hypothetical protein
MKQWLKLQAKKGGLNFLQPISHDRLPSKKVTPPRGHAQPTHRHISTGEKHQQQEETAVLYSSEKIGMDYVTVAGITTRTGFEQHQLPVSVVKELVDNALDHLDKNTPIKDRITSTIKPQVRVYVAKKPNYVKIIVQNSNFGISGFTENTINSIFDLGSFYSSKRNQFKISRGALGDALKEVLCIPYALADHHGIEGWDEPLTISGGDKSYLIRIKVDKVKQTLHSEIQVKQKAQTSSTEIEVHIPIVKTLGTEGIELLIIKYALLNPHIHFQFESKFEDEEVNKGEQGNRTTLDLPNTTEKTQTSSNLSSIYYYSTSDFNRLILGSSKQTDRTPAYDVMKGIFREAGNFKKDQISLATMSELKSNQAVRKQLYDKMRFIMKPKSKLDLLFDIKDRQESIKSTIECLGFEVSDIKYIGKYGYYKSKDGSFEFPFFFEIAIVNTPDLRRNLLTQYITYKAALAGIKVIQVSEASTSQYCRKCYQKGIRRIQGLFTCAKCGEENADRNAAFNIAYRALGYISKVGVTVKHAQIKVKNFCYRRQERNDDKRSHLF